MVCYNQSGPGMALGPDPYRPVYSLFCMRCGHSAEVRHEDAREIWGDGTSSLAVARSLSCTRCGIKRGQFMIATGHGSSKYPQVTPQTVAALKTFGPTMARRQIGYHNAWRGWP